MLLLCLLLWLLLLMSWLSDPILIEVNDKSESSDESESEKAAVEVDDTEEEEDSSHDVDPVQHVPLSVSYVLDLSRCSPGVHD